MSNSHVAPARAYGKRTQALAKHAEEIRRLGRHAAQEIIEIGGHLIEAKKLAGHGSWGAWLEMEFGWSERSAQNFIRVAEMAKSANVADLNVDVSSLYLLAAPKTPAAAIEAVAKRSDAGEKLSLADIKDVIAKARPPQTGNVVSIERGKPEPQEPEPEAKTGEILTDSKYRTLQIVTARSKFVGDDGQGNHRVKTETLYDHRDDPDHRHSTAAVRLISALSEIYGCIDDYDSGTFLGCVLAQDSRFEQPKVLVLLCHKHLR